MSLGIYATTTSLQVLMVGTVFDTATTALASKLITHSENEVNKWLSKRYDVTALSASVPPLVTSLTETLAEGYVYQRMSRGGKEADQRGKILIGQVLENLKLISDYKLDLVDSGGAVVVDMSQTAYRVLSSTSGYTDTFNEDDPLDWGVDPDKLSDIEDGRE
ncbi:hypothetical protein UFOVP903_55 [uncultured Caudovirales phage]|uniref:Uncharacterized protein n=1 Tax=uncultured Caudovirales phage TaxID=2100421 RepID=A0A6J5PGB9_9CAUD|nr:hypothetical protein UFOVP903_55 [uncultured Caudovirales phage]CAB4198015.1 hypothetical protein UFOVP1318_49 [uncultured Caudovirales phage]CAB4210883.1 hypothetical protein UFOVP1430_53 [uncultured Caudovirales phage]